MTYVNKKQAGFTIIEMLLAMTFVAALLIGIALAVMKLGTTYNRGITVTEVNQAGRDLSGELTRAIAASGTFDVDTHLHKLATDEGKATGGRLCTGQFSYVWNYADALQNSPTNATVMRYESAVPANNDESKWVRFVRIVDTDQRYCQINETKPSGYQMEQISNADVNGNRVTELIKPGDRRLNIYQFDVSSNARQADELSGQRVYNASFTIGAGAADSVTDDKTQCRPPNDPLSDLDYCSVQQFKLVIRAGNGVN